MQQNKTLFIILAVVAAVAAISFGAWKFLSSNPPAGGPPTSGVQEQAPQNEATSTYGTLPEIESVSNPLENSPDLNPVERANPFKDIYKNPFE